MQSHPIASEQSPLPRPVYTIREACRVSTLGRATIYNHINSGRLSVVRVGGRTLVPAHSLHALLLGQHERQVD